MSPATAEFPPLKLFFGHSASATVEVGVPVLAGPEADELFAGAAPLGHSGPFALFRQGDWQLGAATVAVAAGLESTARQLYLELFHATAGRHLARIWNYVPAINETGRGGLENYRAFCAGRSLAFEQSYGADFKFLLPAASAVGSQSTALTIVFAASLARPRHVENPAQVPAYDYPREYGPRAPSFARATVVPDAGAATVFISGTAAIRGHATVAPDGIVEQLACTLENLREISRACGLGPNLDQPGRSSRHFKVYLRHAADLPLVAATLREQLFRAGDRVSYLRADICRKALQVEIEVALLGVENTARL